MTTETHRQLKLVQYTNVRYNNDIEEDDAYYNINIEVKTFQYETKNKQEYYQINIEYLFEKGFLPVDRSSYMEKLMHPMYIRGGLKLTSSIDGIYSKNEVLIVKNDLTTTMIRYLLMSDEELALYSGHSTPQKYRQNIILAISYFW
jgi:hypothetical protein